MNECTIDSCDPNTGCINVQISCDDNDESTWDSCDPAGGCLHTPLGQGYY
jgi:hypothetical protein